VTLHHHGELRGCIGTLEPVLSLAKEVVENARHAAFHDPRFPALTQKEFLEIDMEISVLSPPMAMDYAGPEDLKNKLKPGIHGVILKNKTPRQLFTPGVGSTSKSGNLSGTPVPQGRLVLSCLEGQRYRHSDLHSTLL